MSFCFLYKLTHIWYFQLAAINWNARSKCLFVNISVMSMNKSTLCTWAYIEGKTPWKRYWLLQMDTVLILMIIKEDPMLRLISVFYCVKNQNLFLLRILTNRMHTSSIILLYTYTWYIYWYNMNNGWRLASNVLCQWI